ncbi:hypothetical protein KAR29_10630 [Aminithiophilus ramosus]|uniref:NADH:quinone oxidoreductase/Mrp antiporter transmembrane domain-containing protein n=2 Tax=Synergistales TaxID=649776 RepID=A0A9Q7A6D2_9BACT|nr:proton-conducting transporter membrane subunit [Aminithiophilus ramosus]QTX31786.1 hypothetical protein KAR29_10630 [Aminithiophilus ramosus]QVL35608.1 hypothetical protein KIH16_10560 [Synergistota bacterium]
MIRPDGLSLVMIVLALFMTLCAALYRWTKESGPPSDRGGALPLWLFCLFASLAALAADWLTFIIFLELSTLSLFVVVRRRDEETALFFLLSQLTGASVLFVAAALASSSGLPPAMGPVPEKLFPLFVAGLGVKAALPGLHFWLPRTHAAAPTEASALLSGYAVKMAIYGLLRLAGGPSTPLVAIGVVMALYGVVQALMQHDGKRLLAYHTVSQLGFIVAALATGTTLGRTAALLHVVAHALFKGLLFLSAGSLEKLYGSRDLAELGRAGREAPLLFGLFLVGATAITGCPLTSGYMTKIVIKTSLSEYPPALWGLQLAGVGTTLSFCKFGYYGFFRPSGPDGGRSLSGKLERSSYLSMTLLALATVAFGATPFVRPLLPFPAERLLSAEALVGSLIPLAAGLLLFVGLRSSLRPGKGDVPDAEDLLVPAGRLASVPLLFMRALHTGRLRTYLALLVAALLSVFQVLMP